VTLQPSKNLRLFQIGLGEGGNGEFKHRQKLNANSTAEALDKVNRFAKKGPNAASEDKPSKAPTDLSIEVDSSDTTYVIRIEPDIQTAFGPGPNPIMILPPHLGKDLLSDVGLIDEDGVFTPAEDIDYDFAKRPKNAALTFRCNLGELKKAWAKYVDKIHPNHKIEIPIYFNLYDTKTGGPVWAYDKNRYHDDHHRFMQEEESARLNVETHGGIHPKSDDDHHIKTHGGIHPGGASQYLYEYP
jgi:hypothetical protein